MNKLNKKHFKSIAEILNKRFFDMDFNPIKLNNKEIKERLLNDFINYFKTENSLFNENKFREVVLRGCLK